MAEPEPMDESSFEVATIDMEDGEGNTVSKSKYQKENVFIHLLPYYNELEAETEELLDKTLVNLSKAIVGRNVLKGFSLYAKSVGA